jgi:UPF0176 protein
MSIVNISAYRFVSLDDLPTLRERMLERCDALALKGTILLAPEGINLFLAGDRVKRSTLHGMAARDRASPISSRRNRSPTTRRSAHARAPEEGNHHHAAADDSPGRRPRAGGGSGHTQRWLDQGHDDDGREVVLLDTRNDYETDLGMFPHAVDYRIASFTEFPAAIAADRARYDGKTVVSYCTGGIRCEKAVLHMQDIGMQHVYQLEGGILKYFEEVCGAHWHGDCFVFDERGAVDKALEPLSPPGISPPDEQDESLRSRPREPRRMSPAHREFTAAARYRW